MLLLASCFLLLFLAFLSWWIREQLEFYLPIMTFGDHNEVSLKRALTRLLTMPRELRDDRRHHAYTPPDVLLSLLYHLPCSTGKKTTSFSSFPPPYSSQTQHKGSCVQGVGTVRLRCTGALCMYSRRAELQASVLKSRQPFLVDVCV